MDFTALEADLCRWRRHVHEHPELSYQEFQTAAYVESELRAMGIQEIEAPTPTSRTAVIRGELADSRPTRTFAIRADMDALPVEEAEGLPFRSLNSGVSHACGHDAHVAMLLGTAKMLWAKRALFAGAVKLIFQHAEEKSPGGAVELVKAGVLEGVDACMGLHVMNGRTGHIDVCVSPTASSSADGVWIEVAGCGTHASVPQGGVDPILVGAEIVTALHTIVSRSIAPDRFAVVSPTIFQGGGVINVIPHSATIAASIRAKTASDRRLIKERVETIARGIASAHGAHVSFRWEEGCPAVVQDPGMAERALRVAKTIVPPDHVHAGAGMSGSEDFSYFSEQVPSVYVILGGGDVSEGYPYQNHHPAFRFNESVLLIGTQMETAMALDFLRD